MSAGPELSLEELDQKDQDYRADLEHNQRPSNIIMLRMLPPNATVNEVNRRIFKGWLFFSFYSHLLANVCLYNIYQSRYRKADVH